jgi:hypothetical protein
MGTFVTYFIAILSVQVSLDIVMDSEITSAILSKYINFLTSLTNSDIRAFHQMRLA